MQIFLMIMPSYPQLNEQYLPWKIEGFLNTVDLIFGAFLGGQKDSFATGN